jgi:hypothetical protein
VARNVVKAEARRLIEQYGDEAYAKASATVRLAIRSRNIRMTAFLSGVLAEVARQTKLRQLAPRTLGRPGILYLRIATRLERPQPAGK